MDPLTSTTQTFEQTRLLSVKSHSFPVLTEDQRYSVNTWQIEYKFKLNLQIHISFSFFGSFSVSWSSVLRVPLSWQHLFTPCPGNCPLHVKCSHKKEGFGREVLFRSPSPSPLNGDNGAVLYVQMTTHTHTLTARNLSRKPGPVC